MKRGAGEDWFEADPKRRRFFRGTGNQVKCDMLRRMEPSTEHVEPTIIVLIGGTGLGKTAAAMEFLKDLDFWTPAIGTKPFPQYCDGYRGQKYIFLDDFDGFCVFRALLKLWGGYQQRAEVKCSGTVIRAHTYIVTMDRPFNAMKFGAAAAEADRAYLDLSELAQLERRITVTYHFEPGQVNEPPLPPHPLGRKVGLIRLKNGLRVRPYHLLPRVGLGQAEGPLPYQPPDQDEDAAPVAAPPQEVPELPPPVLAAEHMALPEMPPADLEEVLLSGAAYPAQHSGPLHPLPAPPAAQAQPRPRVFQVPLLGGGDLADSLVAARLQFFEL